MKSSDRPLDHVDFCEASALACLDSCLLLQIAVLVKIGGNSNDNLFYFAVTKSTLCLLLHLLNDDFGDLHRVYLSIDAVDFHVEGYCSLVIAARDDGEVFPEVPIIAVPLLAVPLFELGDLWRGEAIVFRA